MLKLSASSSHVLPAQTPIANEVAEVIIAITTVAIHDGRCGPVLEVGESIDDLSESARSSSLSSETGTRLNPDSFSDSQLTMFIFDDLFKNRVEEPCQKVLRSRHSQSATHDAA